MKKFLLLLVVFISSVFSQQIGYVEYNHRVYDFLYKMETDNHIDGYDAFQIPKTRKQICKYLIELKNANLKSLDREILNDLLKEFAFDINGSTKFISSIYEDGFDEVFSQKNKYLYYSIDEKNSIFVNGVLNISSINELNRKTDATRNSSFVQFGGIISGTIFNNFGFMIKGTNGSFQGDKSLLLDNTSLKYNYKFSSNPLHQTATDYFDETEGYFAGEFENFRFKIGRDRSLLGYGINKIILGDEAPPFDYISLGFNYKFFNYNYYHGKLIGTNSFSNDQEDLLDKYFVYHRFSFDFGKHLNFGIGEVVIYADRGIDLSYLNPFNFYKSVEHLNQDRDNTILFLDIENRSFEGIKFYGSLLIDDIDFGKIGNGWYGNKTIISIGAHSTLLYDYLPLEITAEYLRIQPYVFAHRIYKNNYTSLNYSLVDPIEPNSDIFSLKFKYTMNSRIFCAVNYKHKRHGKNIYNEDGELIKNVGGDILIGHRNDDSDFLNFLDGERETLNHFNMLLSIEPIRNYFILIEADYDRLKFKDKVDVNLLTAQLKFMLKF